MRVNRNQEKKENRQGFGKWIDTLFDQSDISCVSPSSFIDCIYDRSCDRKKRKEGRQLTVVYDALSGINTVPEKPRVPSFLAE